MPDGQAGERPRAPGLVRNAHSEGLDSDTADTVDRIAKRAGVSVEFSDDAHGSGTYRDGKIVIRADAENPMRQVLVHELTHHLETSGEYQALSDLVIGHLKETGQDVELQLAAITREYRQHGEYLSEEGARKELVAKFAEGSLFTDERSIRRLAQQDRSLAQKIRDWLHDLLARLGGSREERAETRFLQEAERLYIRALDSAGGRQTGAVQYMLFSSETGTGQVSEEQEKVIHNAVLDKVLANADALTEKGVVRELTGREFEDIHGRRDIVDAVTEYFDSLGGAVERSGFGRILISKRGVKDSLAHGFGDSKKISFAAVPDIIRDGVQIDFQPNWKSRGVDSYLFAGQVRVNGVLHDMGVVVLRSPQNNRYYLHEIIAIEKGESAASFQTGASQNGGLPGDAQSPVSNDSVTRPTRESKKKNSEQKSYGGSLSELNGRLAQLTEEEKKALIAENQRQKARIEYLEGQLKRTPPGKRSGVQVRKAVRQVLRDYESQADAVDITKRLQELWDDMGAGGERSLSAHLYEKALPIAADIVKESRHLNDELSRQYKGMRDMLRTTPVTLAAGDQLSIVEGYNEFRRRNMGRLRLVNEGGMPVDTMYEQLRQGYGDAFFPEDISHPADRLERIGEMLDSLKPVYENPYSNALGDAAHTLAVELIVRGTAIDGAKPTVADRFADKLQTERHGNQESLQEMERVKGELLQEKQRRTKELDQLREHYRARDEKRKQGLADRLQREKLFKVAKRVERMYATPQNRAKIEELVGTLDLLGIGIRKGTELRLGKLRDAMKKQTEQRRAYDPDWEPDTRLEKALERLDNRKIAEMEIGDVEELMRALLAIEQGVYNENRMVQSQDRRDAYTQAVETVKSIEQAKSPGTQDGWLSRNKYLSAMLSPERYVRRLVGYDDNSPLYRLTKELSDGQRKMMDFDMRSERFFDKWHGDRKFMKKLTGKKAKLITIQGAVVRDGKAETVQVKITPAQQVSLFLNNRHGENRRHITEGGIVIPDAKLYAKGDRSRAFAEGVHLRLDEDVLSRLTANMDSDVRAYAEAVSRWFNGMAKDAINEASVQLDGYERAVVKNYFPIRTDPDFNRSESEIVKYDKTLEGMGILRKRMHGKNPLLLEDVTDVLEQHKQSTARYYGLAAPVRNLNRLLNVTGTDSEWSVKRAIREKWGSSAVQYLEDMLADVQGARKGSGGGVLPWLRSNAAGAVLTFSPSVIMKQAASYPTAAGVLGWKPVVQALNPRAFTVDMDTIARYTPDYWYRRKGYSTSELGDIVSRKKGLPWFLNLIQGVDLATTRTLWLASEYYVRDQNRGKAGAPEIRTDAYYKQVAEVYNRVIEESQPNYSVMQRPGILRSPNELTKSLVMFKTQSFQNFNLLYDAYANWRAKARAYGLERSDDNRKALKEARRGFSRQVSAQVVSAMVLSGMTFASSVLTGRVKKYEDEDEKEMTRLSVLTQLAKDFAASLSGCALAGGEAWSAVDALALGGTWYDIDAGGVSSVNDIIGRLDTVKSAARDLFETYEDEEEEVTGAQKQRAALQGWRLAKVVAEDIGGVPAGNLEKLAHAVIVPVLKKRCGAYTGEYWKLLLRTDAETVSSEYLDLLYKAYREKSPKYEELRERMMDELGYSEEKIENGFKARQKKTKEYLETFGGTADGLREQIADSPLYQQNAGWAEERIGDYAREAAKEASDDSYTSDRKWYQAMQDAGSVGLAEGDVLLYRLALEIANDDGNDSISQAEAQEALDGMSGLTQAQKAFLFGSTNTAWKKNPYQK